VCVACVCTARLRCGCGIRDGEGGIGGVEGEMGHWYL